MVTTENNIPAETADNQSLTIKGIDAVGLRRSKHLYTFREAANAIADQLHQGKAWAAKLLSNMQKDSKWGFASVPETKLITRNLNTGDIEDPTMSISGGSRLVHPADVNSWLAASGAEYRWNWHYSQLPEPAPVAKAGSIKNAPDVSTPTLVPPLPKKRTRRDILTPVIELAQSKCKNPQDTSEVWAALCVIALNGDSLLEDAGDAGVKYTVKGKVKYLKRDAFYKRLHPERRGGPGKRSPSAA